MTKAGQITEGGDNTYTHVREKDEQTVRNLAAPIVRCTKAVRTDSKATTLDKFFVSGNVTLRKDIARTSAKNPKAVVP